MVARFPVLWMLLLVLCLVPSGAEAENEVSDLTPPTIISVSLSPEEISTGLSDATITATALLTDDLSGVQYMYIKMRPLEVLRTPDARYDYYIDGNCVFDPTLLDATCTISMTVFQYAYEGVWAIETLSAKDRLSNARNYYHPELPGTWNSETGEITAYYCEMYDNECLPPHLDIRFTILPSPLCAALASDNSNLVLRVDHEQSCGPHELLLPLIMR